jgi:glycosyltransferase involved in cell wall biosynthesis
MKLRILHCPDNVAGNPQCLARTERELGLQSLAVAFTQNSLGYKTDEVLWSPGESKIVQEARRWKLLWRALNQFDIVHFNFGQSILPPWVPASRNCYLQSRRVDQKILGRIYQVYTRTITLKDLLLLRRAGKGIVVTYQGDDARQGDFCLKHFQISPAHEVEPGYYSPETDDEKRKRIEIFSRYADRIYSLNPDLLHVLPSRAQFLSYSHVDLREWVPDQKRDLPSAIPVVLHAPSHRGVKGTRYILEAVSRLKKRGVPFEFRLVEGIPHSRVKGIYQAADLLIDQLLCGWYGGLAVEFMALGKPVICYLRQEDLSFIPIQMRNELPVIPANPETVEQVLEEWLTSRKQDLVNVGKRSRDYVERWHDPLKIARKLKEDYESIFQEKSVGRSPNG